MTIGSKAIETADRLGFSMVFLYALYVRSGCGDDAASEEISRLIDRHEELSLVFYCFESADKRVSDARKAVGRLKKRRSSYSQIKGSFARLSNRTSKTSSVRGGLPSLGKRR